MCVTKIKINVYLKSLNTLVQFQTHGNSYKNDARFQNNLYFPYTQRSILLVLETNKRKMPKVFWELSLFPIQTCVNVRKRMHLLAFSTTQENMRCCRLLADSINTYFKCSTLYWETKHIDTTMRTFGAAAYSCYSSVSFQLQKVSCF